MNIYFTTLPLEIAFLSKVSTGWTRAGDGNEVSLKILLFDS